MNQNTPKSHGLLIDAYNQMMHTIRAAFETTDITDISLQKALNMAKQETLHMGVLTVEEAQQVSEFVKRDINDAAEHMMETSANLGNWLMLDIEVLERKVIEVFLSVAERTRIELESFTHYHRELALYDRGEIIGPGMLKCTQCAKCTPFLTIGHIPACTRCGNTAFRRTTKCNDCKEE